MVTRKYNIRNTDDDGFDPLDRTDEQLTKYGNGTELIEGGDSLNKLSSPYQVSPAFTEGLKQGVLGIGDLAIGLGETVYNVGKSLSVNPPTPGYVPPEDFEPDIEKTSYTKLPRLVSEEDRMRLAEEGGLPGMAGQITGGLAAGFGAGQIGAVRNLLFAAPVENAIVNTATRFFSNPQLGKTVLGTAIRAGGRMTGYATGGAAANIIGDTGYNLAESTDEEGNIDIDSFSQRTADSAFWGAVFGGGVSLADPMVFKDIKSVVNNLNKTSNIKAKQAIETNSKQFEEVQRVEAEERLQEQLEEQAVAEKIDEPVEEIEIIDEVVDVEELDDDFIKGYKEKVDQPPEIDDLEIEGKRSIFSSAREKVKDVQEDLAPVKEIYENLVRPAGSKMLELSPVDGALARRQQVRSKVKRSTYSQALEPFAKAYKKTFKENIIDKALKFTGKKSKADNFKEYVSNGEFDKARNLLAEQKQADELLEGFDVALNTYDQIADEAIAIGIMKPESRIENYWARLVKDPEVFIKKGEDSIVDPTDLSDYQKHVAKIVEEKGAKLTPREKAQALASYLNSSSRIRALPRNLRKRTVSRLDSLNRDAYADPMEAMNHYINEMTDKIELHKYLTFKNPKFDPYAQPKKLGKRTQRIQSEDPSLTPEQAEQLAVKSLYDEQRIGDPSKVITDEDVKLRVEEVLKDPRFENDDPKIVERFARRALEDENRNLRKGGFNAFDTKVDKKVEYLVNQGLLKGEDAKAYKEYLTAVFAKGKMARPKILRTLSNLGYGALLGNVYSASTQLKDAGVPMSRYGVGRVAKEYLKGILGQGDLKLSDVGLDNLVDEMFDVSNQGKIVNTVLGPLSAVDKLGKVASVNAALQKFQKSAQSPKGEVKIRNKYKDVYSEQELDGLIESLRNKDNSDWKVRDLMLYELSDVQPIDLLDRPKMYLENPAARSLYDLKTFMLKRQDYIFNGLKKEMKDTGNAAPLLSFLALVPIVNASIDMAQDGTRQREVNALDSYLSGFMDSFGLNRYSFQSARRGSQYATDVMTQVLPLNPGALASMGSTLFFDLKDLASGEDTFADMQMLRFTPFVGAYMPQIIEGGQQGGRTTRSRSPRRRIRRTRRRRRN